MKCTLDRAGPVGTGKEWQHDLTPGKPTFRFKYELLARVQYLEAQLAAASGSKSAVATAAASVVPEEEYARLRRKVCTLWPGVHREQDGRDRSHQQWGRNVCFHE